MKSGLLALTALVAVTSAATADCRILPGRFSMSQNTAVSTTAVSTRGAACGVRFTSSAVSRFDSVTVAKRPSHGALREVGALSYLYKPTGGFKGVDSYALRICGTDAAGPGCATITYNITVE
jgi:hypothetical protein